MQRVKLKLEVEIDTENQSDNEMIVVLIEKIAELKQLLEGFVDYDD
jgi:hypothetical protein